MPRPPAAPREGTLRPDRRLRAWVITVLVALSLLGGRLVQLQGADASVLADAALAQRSYKQTLWADRGDIVDAAGVQLAAYRLGWSRLAGVPVEQVSAGFHHVAAKLTVRPVDLLDEAGLLALVEGTA